MTFSSKCAYMQGSSIKGGRAMQPLLSEYLMKYIFTSVVLIERSVDSIHINANEFGG